VALVLSGCANQTLRARAYAQRNGMTASVIQGTRFAHRVFTKPAAPQTDAAADAGILYVFIEGDGSPWVGAGRRVAKDPTPHRPLALELAAATPRAILYLGRPCYFETRVEAICTPDLWTSGRYSAEVVDSLVAAVRRYAATDGNPQLILIGYSGGGTLAVLMAAQLPKVRGVITIAANLDVDAWARWHRYLPLSASVNPAAEQPLTDSIRQWHLVGGKDDNVPEALNRRYFDALGPDQVWHYPAFDHVCCWTEHWASILARIDQVTIEPGRRSLR
jgi:pimeloyl-ACP methyl ester carboxylesterase